MGSSAGAAGSSGISGMRASSAAGSAAGSAGASAVSSGTGSNLGSSMKSSFPYERENIIKQISLSKKSLRCFWPGRFLTVCKYCVHRSFTVSAPQIAPGLTLPSRSRSASRIASIACVISETGRASAIARTRAAGAAAAARGQGRDEKGLPLRQDGAELLALQPLHRGEHLQQLLRTPRAVGTDKRGTLRQQPGIVPQNGLRRPR